MSTHVAASTEGDRTERHTPKTEEPSAPETTNTEDGAATTTDVREVEPTSRPSVTDEDAGSLSTVSEPSSVEDLSTSPATSMTDAPTESTGSPEDGYTSADIALPPDLTVPPGLAHTHIGEAPEDDDDGKMPGGATAAVAVGALILIAAMAYGIWAIQRRRRHGDQKRSPDFASLSSSYDHAVPMENLGPKGPPDSPPVGLDTWLEYQGAGDPRASIWPRMQSPSPQPAVAEVQSFTRTRQKPRVCDIRGMRRPPADAGPGPLPGAEGPTPPGCVYRDERARPPRALTPMPMTPSSWGGRVSPLSPDGEYAPAWPYQGGFQGRYPSTRLEWNRWCRPH